MIIDCAAYIDGTRTDVDPTPASLSRWAAPMTYAAGAVLTEPAEGFVWLGLRVPNEDEVDAACTALQLNDVSAHEVLTPHARPVLTVSGDTLQLVLRTARYDDQKESVDLGEMTLLVGPRSIISIRHGQASELTKVRAALERDPEHLGLGPMTVLAAVVTRVIDDYGLAIDGFETDAIEVEREVFSDSREQPVKRLYRLKREVRRMLVAIDALQDPLTRLIRGFGARLPAAVVADLNEASDQLDRAVTRTQSLSGLLDAALAASQTQITVQQNDDMRKISAWVAMAAVPTLVAGVYGMNFDTMPELGWRLGYPLVLGIMGVVVAVLYRSFKRSGWL